MTETTARLALPFIIASQAQKEVTHNMALNILDLMVQPAVESVVLSDPPLAPQDGQAWIVAAGASGDWSGREGQVACYTGGGWSFIAPFAGMVFRVLDSGLLTLFQSGMWQTGVINAVRIEVAGQQVVGERQSAIADASGGQVIDEEARISLNALLSACRSHGLIEN
jgi:hypothetical protein